MAPTPIRTTVFWITGTLVLFLSLGAFAQGSSSQASETAIEQTRQQVRQSHYAQCDLSLFLAGDTILHLPWSLDDDPDFLKLIGEVRAADVAIVNLETLIHEFRGYAQADSGGTYMAAPPEIADDLKWAGIDMVGHANNHTFDYGPIGVLENLENVSAAGILLAGSGPDLQRAREPRYLTHDGGTVALVSMASTFVPYGKASLSRADMRGRPGLNPLSLTSETIVAITPAMAKTLRRLVRAVGFRGRRFSLPEFEIWGQKFVVGDKFELLRGVRPTPEDRSANLAAVGEAAVNADIVVVSLHYHGDDDWLGEFAREAIDHGASVVLVHGKHRVLGIEVYQDRPIFYGLGDFAFQSDFVARLPAEFFERYGLNQDATPEQAIAARSKNGTRWLSARRYAFEGAAASLCFADGTWSAVRLIPVDLRFDASAPERGHPLLASAELGARIVDEIRSRSDGYGTAIDFDAAEGFARVGLSAQQER